MRKLVASQAIHKNQSMNPNVIQIPRTPTNLIYVPEQPTEKCAGIPFKLLRQVTAAVVTNVRGREILQHYTS